MQYATKAARIGAYIIDNIILNLLVFLCSYISVGLGLIIAFVGGTLYYGIMEGSNLYATLGKYLMGIVIVNENGQPIDYGKSFTRAICRMLSSMLFGIGFLIGLFDDEGKTLHDRIAGTRVVAKASICQPSAAVYEKRAMNRMEPQQPVQRSGYSASQPKIVGVAGKYAGQAYPVGPQGLIMGREQNVCDFVFESNTGGISRTHCKIQYNPQTGMFVLHDMGSSYGTFLENGVCVSQGQPVALRPGEQFYLADRSCMFMVTF